MLAASYSARILKRKKPMNSASWTFIVARVRTSHTSRTTKQHTLTKMTDDEYEAAIAHLRQDGGAEENKPTA
jgi:hypothetical protein